MDNEIGTLLRCAHVTEERLAFFHRIGLNCIQIAGVYEEHLAPTQAARDASDRLFELFAKYGIGIPTMFLGFTGQDWHARAETVGLVPEKYRAGRLVCSCRQMLWAKRYGIRHITCHVGFLSAFEGEAYERLVQDLKQLARFAASLDETFLFETGTESVAEYKKLLADIDEPSVGLNFDPANLLIYDRDDPAVYVNELSQYIKVMHCKDAVRPAPGKELGVETVIGQGGTNFTALLKQLQSAGFNGPYIIERELPTGPEQEKDISDAVKLIATTLA